MWPDTTCAKTKCWAKTQNRSKKLGSFAKHHIIPKSFYASYCDDGWIEGDYDDPDNLVLLSHREHAWCHLLLALRMTSGLARSKMIAPLKMLIDSTDQYRLCSRLLTSIMKENALAIKNRAVERWKSEDNRVKHSLIMKEAMNRPEVKVLRSLCMKQAQSKPEVREKRSLSMKKRLADPIVKEKYSQAAKKSMADPEVKVKHKNACKLFSARPEVKQKRSLAQKKVFSNPDRKAELLKMSAIAAEKTRDPTIYIFTHKSGEIFIGTRYQHRLKYGYLRKQFEPLFRSKPGKTALGWSVKKMIS